MQDLIIVGASGFGREILQYIEDINAINPIWNFIGFIDDNINALDGISQGRKIVDTIHGHIPNSEIQYVCGLAFPKVKKEIVTLLKNKGARFTTLIHPTARISRYSKIGEGCVITPNSNVNADAEVGNFVSILASGIGHDAKVGNYSTLSGHVAVNGHVEIGEEVYIGCGALIAPSKKIGKRATVGMGSVVISNVKSETTVFGNPAKKILL